MSVIVGPVLARTGGYAFDTWTTESGVRCGFVYRRIEDTYYARASAIDAAMLEGDLTDGSDTLEHVRVCDTLEQFTSELVDRGALLTDSALQALCSLQMA